MARIKYGEEGLEKSNNIRARRSKTLPLDLLATTPTDQPQSQSKQKVADKTPVEEKIPEKEKLLKKELGQERSGELIDTSLYVYPKLLKEWQQFDSIISNTESLQGFSTPEVTTSQKSIINTVLTKGTSGPPITQKDVEIISENPFDEIVLNV